MNMGFMKTKIMRSGKNGIGFGTLPRGGTVWRTRWIFFHLSRKPLFFLGW